MRNGKENRSCLFGEEIVSYIYGELGAERHAAFEKHLLECIGCTAEFADISMSRLGVYEWHRDEFVPLATPQFAIPYETAPPKVSWIDALRGLATSPLRLGFAGASLAIAIFGFVLFSNYGSSENSVAGAVESGPAPPASLPVRVAESEPSTVETVSKFGREPKPVREFRDAQPVRQKRAIQAKITVPKKRLDAATANTASSAPRLGNFVDTEDKSLRLADLVADITRD